MIIVSIYNHLIKYEANQKHLLPFHDTKLKIVPINTTTTTTTTNNNNNNKNNKNSNNILKIYKNQTYYFFNYVIDIENFDPNNIKINEKSNKNIIFFTGYATIKEYVKSYSVNLLYLIFWYVNVYFSGIIFII